MKLKDKSAVVTGAGSGIGQAIAIAFAREGAKVVVSGHHVESCRETVAMIEKDGGVAQAVACDVSQADHVEALTKAAVQSYGSLDILVNNAGVAMMSPLEQTTDETWDAVINVDLKGVFLGMKYALPEMEKAGYGKIINISSIAGIVGFNGAAAYCAAKGGVNNLTREAAVEYAPKKINVNAIAPGVIKTKMVDPFLGDEQMKAFFEGKTPYPRLGEVEDIAAGAVYLASADSDFVNGEVLVIDGGWVA